MKQYKSLFLLLFVLLSFSFAEAQTNTDFWCGDEAMGHSVQIIAGKSRCNDTQNRARNVLTQGSVLTNCTLDKEVKGGYGKAKKYFKKNWKKVKAKLNKDATQNSKAFIEAGDLLFEIMSKKQKKK